MTSTGTEAVREDALDCLFNKWREAHSALTLGEHSDKECRRLAKRENELFWEMVRTPAGRRRHIEMKFVVLDAETQDDDDLSPCVRAMLESIRRDCREH